MNIVIKKTSGYIILGTYFHFGHQLTISIEYIQNSLVFNTFITYLKDISIKPITNTVTVFSSKTLALH